MSQTKQQRDELIKEALGWIDRDECDTFNDPHEAMADFAIEQIIAFCNEVDERAQKLMLADGKVSGKHYAAMRLILKERYGKDWGR